MASGTADLQRDLGGAIMQSILGALLTAGYASVFTADIAASPEADSISEATQSQLLRSFSSAEATAQQYPQYAEQITAGARDAFTRGQNWAYAAGCLAIVLGAALVAWRFPRHDEEREMLAAFAREDAAPEAR